MKRIAVSSLGFELTKEVAGSAEEYNALAPKRDNPVVEDANNSLLYRSTFPVFRATFLEELAGVTGIQRINHGTEEEPQWETEKKWYARMVAANGGNVPTAWQAIAQKHMDAAPFDPSEREAKGPSATVGKRDLAMAEELLKRGAEKVAAVCAALSQKLGRTVETDAKSIAKAFADHRRNEAKAAEERQKAELGL